MIVGAVLCPAAPLLIPGVANGVAVEQSCWVPAVRSTVGRLAARSDRILVVTAGRQPRWTDRLPIDLGIHPFGRGPGRRTVETTAAPTWAPGIWVARTLLPHGDLIGCELDLQSDLLTGAGISATGPIATDPSAALGLLVLADGALCHGPAAPAAADDRADPFEHDLQRALSTGDPATLRSWATGNRELASELGATTPGCLALLAELSAGSAWSAAAEYLGAPYGVGYHLASWWR